MTPPTLAEQAAALAKAGWPVFPVDASTKRPRTLHGHLDASTDVKKITTVWRNQFNWGGAIATITGNGLLVIDVDPRNGGRVPEWCPPTRLVKTQSGGYHLHYKLEGGDIISRASLFGPGVDSKSAGGYVLIPPSPGYEWLDLRPRAVLLRAVVESHIAPGILNDRGAVARRAPAEWYRGIIHDQVVAWAAYFANELDDDEEVEAATWGMVNQARESGTKIDNARDHIGSAIRWVLAREANNGPDLD